MQKNKHSPARLVYLACGIIDRLLANTEAAADLLGSSILKADAVYGRKQLDDLYSKISDCAAMTRERKKPLAECGIATKRKRVAKPKPKKPAITTPYIETRLTVTCAECGIARERGHLMCPVCLSFRVKK
jgi:hypothetical protein